MAWPRRRNDYDDDHLHHHDCFLLTAPCRCIACLDAQRYDKDHYKLALGQLNTVRHLVQNVQKDYVRMVKYGA